MNDENQFVTHAVNYSRLNLHSSHRHPRSAALTDSVGITAKVSGDRLPKSMDE